MQCKWSGRREADNSFGHIIWFLYAYSICVGPAPLVMATLEWWCLFDTSDTVIPLDTGGAVAAFV